MTINVRPHRRIFPLLLLLCLPVFNPLQAEVGDETDARIKGFSKFILERANANYLYIFERNLASNKTLKRYFPHTHELASQGDLQILLSSAELWEETLNRDIDILISESVETIKVNILYRLAITENKYLEMLDQIMLRVDNQCHGLTQVEALAPETLSPSQRSLRASYVALKKELNIVSTATENLRQATQTENHLQNLETALDAIKEKIRLKVASFSEELQKNAAQIKDCFLLKHVAMPDILLENAEKAANQRVQRLMDLLGAFAAHQNSSYPVFENTYQLLEQYHNFVERREEWQQRLKIYADAVKKAKEGTPVSAKKPSYVSLIIQIESYLRVAIANTETEKGMQVEGRDYQRFKRAILLFASVADAKSEDQVYTLLKQTAMPAVSFGVKRQAGENHGFLTAYFGGTIGREHRNHGEENRNYATFSVPVGLEFSRGIQGHGAINLMLAPFDLAYPISLQLYQKDEEEEVEVEDIFAPGIYLTYGRKDLPVVMGASYTVGRGIRTGNQENDHIGVFFGLELPLFSLF